MQSTDGETVSVYFVIPANCKSKNECEPEMQSNFLVCAQLVEDCKWVTEQEVKHIPKTKQNVIVLQAFEVSLFESLTKDKCLSENDYSVVGYRCLQKCVMAKTQIPNFSSPVFNMAMANMTVSVTGLRPNEKKAVKDKVGFMGGKYSPIFTTTTTHLISDCVNSVKYATAVQLKVPIYLPSWLDDVWEKNLKKDLSATDPQFDKHICKPFHKLNVTTTGLPPKDREEIAKLINQNGGEYSGKLSSGFTSVLICKLSGAKSEKFGAAKKFKIECCSKDWVYDSIKAGYALPFDKYQILDRDVASSTLINPGHSVNPNFSMASTIGGDSPRDISESMVNISNMSNITTRFSNIIQPSKLEALMNKFPDLREIKKSGAFLDGCCVYLSGFEGVHRDKLSKILNLGGAIRFDEISDNVTHLIGLDWASSEIEKFHQEKYYPLALSLEWILESITLKSPAPEDNFKLYPATSPVGKETSDRNLKLPSSPLSQKGVHMLRHNSSLNISKFVPDQKPDENIVEPEPSDNYMKEYGEKQGSDPDTLDMFIAGANFTDKAKETTEVSKAVEELLPLEESKQDAGEDESMESLFKGLKFTLINWDDEEQITLMIEEAGGKIHTKTWRTDPPDYIIVPTNNADVTNLPSKIMIATNIWIEECLVDLKVLPILYYHKPISMSDPDSIPLQGCNIAVSSYKTFERSFVIWLLEYLGANFADTMSRANNTKNLPASTHLVCPTPAGSKYLAAVQWGIHVVTHEWLLACAQECRRVPEHIFSLKPDSTPVKLATPKLKHVATPNKPESPNTTPKNSFKTPPIVELENKEPNVEPGCTAQAKQPRLASLDGPIGLSPPRTPIKQFFENIGLPKYQTPDNSPLPRTPSHVDTPNTPLGRCFGVPDPSPDTRKYWAKRINSLPSYNHSPPVKRPRLSSTPLAELKERLWKKVLPKSYYGEDGEISQNLSGDDLNSSSSTATSSESKSTPVRSTKAIQQVEQLKEMIQRSVERGGSRLSMKRAEERHLQETPVRPSSVPVVIESQQGPIGWEDPLEEGSNDSSFRRSLRTRRFMLTQISVDRQRLGELVQSLGGLLSDIPLFNDEATHLVCQSLTRSEKILASVASGKWILHVSYIEDSCKAEEFLDEELYEFGNPKATVLANHDHGRNEILATACHRWRVKISQTKERAYEGMRAILFVPSRKEPVVRLIEAGGGKVLNAVTFDDTDATHCFIDPKVVNENPQCRILASRGVYCLPTNYLNNYLLSETELDPTEHILAALQPYFKCK